MEYLPIFIKLKEQDCLVAGGNEKALAKINLLLKVKARVRVVSPEICEGIRLLADQEKIDYQPREFANTDLSESRLVIVANDDPVRNEEIYNEARKRKIPVNVVDSPEISEFIFPSVIDRSPLIAAVSTGGASPSLAKFIRAKIELMLPHSYGRLANFLKNSRQTVKKYLPDRQGKKKFFDKIFSGPIIEMFLSGKEQEAEQAFMKALEDKSAGNSGGDSDQGFVSLVGAGPGDSGLLTLNALRQIQNADSIVYDHLIGPDVLSFARKDAEMIYVGKQMNRHSKPQPEIDRIVVELAQEGKRVVRLKGGDPLIFGRGGEEIENLVQHKINFQVIPGVTAALGSSAYFGFPLTHREYARTVIFSTGHLKSGRLELNWNSLAQPCQTLVFYMGLSNIKIVTSELIKNGLKEETPAALINNATLPDQKIIVGTLATLPDLILENKVTPPTLVVIGDVVKLHHLSRKYQKNP